MDNLEKYIRHHRQDFDSELPSPSNWQQISSRLTGPTVKLQKNKWSGWAIAKMAAVFVALVGLGFALGTSVNQPNSSISEASPEYASTASHYQQKIAKKMSAVASSTKDTSWKSDIIQLELMMNDLQDEWKECPQASKDDIIQAMIQNYQIRLSILEKILEKTERPTFINTKPKHRHE